MIFLTKLNGKEFILNASLIELVEANPDTTITTTTGRKLVVKESVDDIIKKSIEFKRRIYTNSIEQR